MNKNIAYFIGVLHSDGYVYIFHDKKKNRDRHRFRLHVAKASYPMVKKIQTIFQEEFNKNIKILNLKDKISGDKMPYFSTEFNNLLPLFNKLDINKNTVPEWITSNQKLFCAYLAGVIDGDGDVCIKRPKYPQCRIKITSGYRLEYLEKLIERHLNCGCWIEPIVPSGKGLPKLKSKPKIAYRHCFYISPKNILIFKQFVYPHIQILHKRKTLEKFFKTRGVSI
jgi:hypothetical protein